MTKNFLRRTGDRYVKLGLGRKKKQKWRRPTGRDNKMREKLKSRPAVVSIGYKKPEQERKKLVEITNLDNLKKLKSNEIPVLGRVGKRRKIEIAKEAKKQNIKIKNLNINKTLKEKKVSKKDNLEDKKSAKNKSKEKKK